MKTIKNKNITFKNRKLGFTLVEIIIVIGIIGTIAAFLIPPVVTKYQKEQTETRYKNSYSEISQALKMAEVENGSMASWSWGTVNNLALTTDFANNYFYPYISTLKKCENGESGCWKDAVSLTGDSGWLDFKSGTWAKNKALSAILKNGSSIYFWAGNIPDVQIWVDVNGPNKGKSIIGKDIFSIHLALIGNSTLKQGIYPYGLDKINLLTRDELKTDETKGCNSSPSGTYKGAYCGALIMLDGWKIADDYPW